MIARDDHAGRAERNERMLRALEQGAKVADLARLFGLTHGGATMALKTAKRARKLHHAETILRIKRMIANGGGVNPAMKFLWTPEKQYREFIEELK